MIANGVGASSGISTNDTDTATAIVVPISIACIAEAGPTPLPASGPVTFQLTINNTGQADLSVAITHNVPCTLPSPVFVAAGGSTNLSCTAQVNCPDGANFSVTVVGTAVASTAVPCVFDSQGQAVTTGPSVCTATVECQAKAGCTPGFWKNCTIHWQPTGYRTDQAVGTVFEMGSCCSSLGNTKLLAALDFGGGSDVCGAARNLLRAAVAALLNAASPEVDYPFTDEQVIASVNAALMSCNRATMLGLASELDRNNNLGCKDANGNDLPCKRLTGVPGFAE